MAGGEKNLENKKGIYIYIYLFKLDYRGQLYEYELDEEAGPIE